MQPITTLIPGSKPIELIDYYDCFKDYYLECELETKSWFVRNIDKDWCIFDCGANIGYYSILFSRFAPKGSIYAFEPTPSIKKLQTNLEHHKISNVTIINNALSDKCGTFIDDVYQIWGEPPLQIPFNFITIDSFVEEYGISRLDCIKIDVDSYDFAVLRGAEKTIFKFNPYIMVELNHALNVRNENIIQVLNWMHSKGYETTEVYDSENFLFKKNLPHQNTASIAIYFPEGE